MDYRKEIDGLRAVAVLPAIFFHAGFQTFSGGFVGVDVFFVISGYLITSIILAERQAGTFTLLNFYERRARRILPALFVVMFACLPLAWLWSPPSEMKSFSDSLVAVSVSASNILFWLTSGYFERDAELKPLLHTWSLAVEEQYYLLFPLFLLLMWRLGKRWIFVSLAVMTVIGLASAQRFINVSPQGTYYLLPTRGWEILIGALVAFHFFGNTNPNFKKSVSEIGSATGLALIAYAVTAFDKHTPFPSVYTLVPTLGTALIILFGTQQTVIGKLLSNKLFVGIGLISYSAYLWHQPLFAFARQRAVDEPGKFLLLSLALVAIGLAFLTWKYIEAPFRSGRKFSRRQVFLYAGTASTLFIAIGVAGDQSKIKTLWQIENPHLVTFTEPKNKPALKNCPVMPEKHGFVFCKISGTGSTRVVLWGDSHGGILAENAPAIPGVELYSLWQYGCPPIAGVRRFDHVGDFVDCNELKILKGYAEFVKSLSPDLVILAGRWTLYLNGQQKLGVLQPAHKLLTDSDTDSSIKPMAEREALFQHYLQETIALLAQHSKVILLTQAPDYASIGFRRMEIADLSLPISDMRAWHKGETDVIEHLKGMPNLTVIDTKKIFCDEDSCRSRDEGALLYSDDDHLSPRGAELVWPMIVDELSKELPTRVTQK